MKKYNFDILLKNIVQKFKFTLRMLQKIPQLRKLMTWADFLDFWCLGFWTKYHWISLYFAPPRMGDFRKISIFLDFESPYLHDNWSDFKKFTHKTYLRVEIRWFSAVSVRKNKTTLYFCRVLCGSIWDFGKSTTYITLYIGSICMGKSHRYPRFIVW